MLTSRMPEARLAGASQSQMEGVTRYSVGHPGDDWDYRTMTCYGRPYPLPMRYIFVPH